LEEHRARAVCACRQEVRSATIDEDNLVLPKLRHGTAGVEDEMLQLSQGGAQLVAPGCGSSRGLASSAHTT